MREYINLIDLNVYVQNAKLKEQYHLLLDDYRKVTMQLNQITKEMLVLKEEMVDLQTKINKWRWTNNKSEEDCWR